MLQREYKKKGISFLEVYYSQNIGSFVASYNLSGVDVVKAYDANKNYKNLLQETCTLHIDLTETEENILKRFRPTTRNEIKRNINKDDVKYTCEAVLDEKRIANFSSNLSKFTHKKNFHKGYRTSEEYLVDQIKNFKQNALLTIVSKGGITLAEHLYFIDNNRARYMYGISYRLDENIDIDRNVIGRSNRGLHWFDMKEMKSRGVKIYDFGGISLYTDDAGLINVKRFKEGFSKNRVFEYSGNIPVSLRGKLGLFVKTFLDRLADIRQA